MIKNLSCFYLLKESGTNYNVSFHFSVHLVSSIPKNNPKVKKMTDALFSLQISPTDWISELEIAKSLGKCLLFVTI